MSLYCLTSSSIWSKQPDSIPFHTGGLEGNESGWMCCPDLQRYLCCQLRRKFTSSFCFHSDAYPRRLHSLSLPNTLFANIPPKGTSLGVLRESYLCISGNVLIFLLQSKRPSIEALSKLHWPARFFFSLLQSQYIAGSVSWPFLYTCVR